MALSDELKRQEQFYKNKMAKMDVKFNIHTPEIENINKQEMNKEQYLSIIQKAYIAGIINCGITLSEQSYLKLSSEERLWYANCMIKKYQNTLKELETFRGYQHIYKYIKTY